MTIHFIVEQITIGQKVVVAVQYYIHCRFRRRDDLTRSVYKLGDVPTIDHT